jgi:hypothetical protein
MQPFDVNVGRNKSRRDAVTASVPGIIWLVNEAGDGERRAVTAQSRQEVRLLPKSDALVG